MAIDFDLQVAVAETVEEMLGGLVRQHQSNSAAVAPGGTVYPEAVRNAIPWLAHDGVIEGTVATGSNQLRWPFPQGGVIRYVSIDAKTPPGSPGLSISLSGGARTESFTLQSGLSSAGFPTSIVMPPGSWARVNVTTGGGAANVAVTILYTSAGTSGGSGGSGSGGGGTGGAVASVNGQTGVVVLDADSISDTSTSHKFVTSGDLTKLSQTSGVNTGDQDLSGYATTSALTSGLAGKADVSSVPDALTDLDTSVTGSQLNSMKSKVDGIEDGAEVNVQADWAASSGDAFVANKPVPITATSGSAIHASTSTSATDYVGGTTLAVPSGEYRIHVFASFPMRRSVGSGDVWIRLRIGGTAGSERGWSLAGTGIAAGQWFTFAYAMNGQTFTTDGSGVLVEFGIRGGGIAGTTNLYQGTVFGTFTKIG